MKYYLLIISNLFMLNISKIFLFFKCEKIVKSILNQCEINNQYIEKEFYNGWNR